MGALTQGVKVTKHGKGAATFSYAPPTGTAGKGHLNIPYYFEGDCSLLDAEGEWCVDVEAKTLKVYLPNCADPATRKFRGKVRDYIFTTTSTATVRVCYD
jgi:hypothetical protein